MKLVIRTKGQVKFTDNVKEHVEKQLSTLEKMFKNDKSITLNLLCEEKNSKIKSEITIVVNQVVLRSECAGDTLYASLDLAIDKIEQQVIKYKKKINAMVKKRNGLGEVFTEMVNDSAPSNEELVRIKKVDLIEMSVDEAITQMELLDHPFYMFKNEESHEVAVVYKRATGGYGLLEENK